MKAGDWIQLKKGWIPPGEWSCGDTSKVVYVSGDYVDVEDRFGGKRGKKGKLGVQRFHKDQIELYTDDEESTINL